MKGKKIIIIEEKNEHEYTMDFFRRHKSALGASIAYTFDEGEQAPWKLYTQPLCLQTGVTKMVSYFNDETVKVIHNQIVTYDKVRDIEIRSELEAYKEILDGKFQHFSKNQMIETLHIHQVEVNYDLDSKGYYQPV